MFSQNGIRAILFDLDGTLRFSEPRFFNTLYDYVVQACFSSTRSGYCAGMRWLHYYWAQSAELLTDIETFGLDSDFFWTNHTSLFIQALGAERDVALQLAPVVQRRMTDEYHPISLVPLEVFSMLEKLKQAGFLLAVVSNRAHNFDDELAELGLDGYFQLTIAAGEVDSWKPDTKIFLHAINVLGICAEQALHVGDSYYADVLGAQRAGLSPVLVDSDGVFPEATCPVISSVAMLGQVLSLRF